MGVCILRETTRWGGTLFSIFWTHAVTHPSHANTLHLRPLPLFHSHASPLKPRRSNPRNLFPCDWLLCCPQRGRAGEEGKGENMSRERQFNMTKPVPGDPNFSSPDPHEPLLFLPSLLIPCFPPFTFWPLQVHFSPLMQIALCSLPYLWPASSSVKYAL